jgi:hypothetical protein
MGDPDQTLLLRKDIPNWFNLVNITHAAEIIGKFFSEPSTKSKLPIADILMRLKFELQFSNEAVEDASLLAMVEALERHEVAHPHENSTTLNELASLIEKRLPPNSQLSSDYLVRKKAGLEPGQLDTPREVIWRIKSCMGAVRKQREDADRYKDFNAKYSHQARGGWKSTTQTLPPLRPEDNPQCRTCGHHGHIPAYCTYKNDPDVNASVSPWSESDIGRQWKRFGHD